MFWAMVSDYTGYNPAGFTSIRTQIRMVKIVSVKTLWLRTKCYLHLEFPKCPGYARATRNGAPK